MSSYDSSSQDETAISEEPEALIASARSLIEQLEVIEKSTGGILQFELASLIGLSVFIVYLAVAIVWPAALQIQPEGRIAAFLPAVLGLAMYVGFNIGRDYQQKRVARHAAAVARKRIERAVAKINDEILYNKYRP
jgi:hypothetical protein